MALALSQHKEVADSSAASSQTLTLTSTTASGDGVVLFVAVRNSTGYVTGVSGLGATWKKAIGPVLLRASGFGDIDVVECWIGTGCTAGNTVVTVTLNASAAALLAASTWTGGLTGIVDTALAQGSNSTAVDMGTTNSPASSGYVAVGFAAWQGNASISSSTDSPGAFTLLGTLYDGGMNQTITHAYRLCGETGAEQRIDNLSSASGWAGLSVILTSASDKLQQPRTESWWRNLAGNTLTVGALNAGDAILLFHQCDGAAGPSSVAGCGATWTRLRGPLQKSVLSDFVEVWLGTGCSAGDGTITVTENGGTSPGLLAVAINTDNQTIHYRSALNQAGNPGTSTTIATGPVQAAAVLDTVYTFFVGSGGGIPTFTDSPGAFMTLDDSGTTGDQFSGGEGWQLGQRITAENLTNENRSGTLGANAYGVGGSVVLSLTDWPPTSQRSPIRSVSRVAVSRAASI